MSTYGARKAKLCRCCVDRNERRNAARARLYDWDEALAEMEPEDVFARYERLVDTGSVTL